MKKTLSLLIFTFSFFTVSSAQDIITKSNGDVIEAIVTEVNPDNVRFKKYSNPFGTEANREADRGGNYGQPPISVKVEGKFPRWQERLKGQHTRQPGSSQHIMSGGRAILYRPSFAFFMI